MNFVPAGLAERGEEPARPGGFHGAFAEETCFFHVGHGCQICQGGEIHIVARHFHAATMIPIRDKEIARM